MFRQHRQVVIIAQDLRLRLQYPAPAHHPPGPDIAQGLELVAQIFGLLAPFVQGFGIRRLAGVTVGRARPLPQPAKGPFGMAVRQVEFLDAPMGFEQCLAHPHHHLGKRRFRPGGCDVGPQQCLQPLDLIGRKDRRTRLAQAVERFDQHLFVTAPAQQLSEIADDGVFTAIGLRAHGVTQKPQPRPDAFARDAHVVHRVGGARRIAHVVHFAQDQLANAFGQGIVADMRIHAAQYRPAWAPPRPGIADQARRTGGGEMMVLSVSRPVRGSGLSEDWPSSPECRLMLR